MGRKSRGTGVGPGPYKVLSSTTNTAAIMDQDDVDPIQPVAIDHHVDELWADDRRKQLLQRYNFLEYHFDKDGRYCRARAYLDQPAEVTLFGPFTDRHALQPVADADFAEQVLTYLKRRYRRVRTL